MSLSRWLLLGIAVVVATFGIALFVLPSSADPPTPIVGGSSFGGAVKISPGVQYSAAVSTTHTADYFKIELAPPPNQPPIDQYLELTFTTGVTFTDADFTLYDQDHASALWPNTKIVSGAEQTYTYRWLGNRTTPTMYYFVVHQRYGVNNYEFSFTLTPQPDGGTAGDAGDTVVTAKTLTPAANGHTVYAGNELGYEDENDWFKIPVASGQIITLTLGVTDYGALGAYPGAGYVDFEIFDETGTKSLGGKLIANPSLVPWTYTWIGSNTYPTAYIVHVLAASKNGVPVRYDMAVDLAQQHDGNMAGDAGDNFETARVLEVTSASPKLVATGNLLGGSDQFDYYRLDLPVPPVGPPARYNLVLDQIVWPATAIGTPPIATYAVKLYDRNRNEIGTPYYRSKPSTAPLQIDVTNCAITGCYLSIDTNLDKTNSHSSYRLQLLPPHYLYLPLVRR